MYIRRMNDYRRYNNYLVLITLVLEIKIYKFILMHQMEKIDIDSISRFTFIIHQKL